jgi:hypothetical protein
MSQRPTRSPSKAQSSVSARLRTAFEALLMKQGSAYGLSVLLQTVVLTGFIDEALQHEIRVEALVAAKCGINEALGRGKAEGVWFLDLQTEELLAAVIAWHDDQLRTTPFVVFAEAPEQLERMRDRKSYDCSRARRSLFL